jgi:4-aminobutyrate aminotransferase/(S)-3-amino-2-methylpropionate transaminase
VEEEFERFNKAGKFVAGVIIEPVQAEGGDNHASPEFFQELQRITKKVPGVSVLFLKLQLPV